MAKISVITPVFNEEKNIENCYLSLCQQTYTDFEWVIIDDGSTDKTVAIIENIITSHSVDKFSIKLLQQENSGASAARENGINNCATGELICILDADDYFSPNSLELAEEKITDLVDIVCLNVSFLENGKIEREFKFLVNQWPIMGKEAFCLCVDGWGLNGFFLAKKEIFINAYELLGTNKLNNINDDELISRFCMFSANLIDVCSGHYYYVFNINSTTKRINNNYHKIVNTAIKLDQFVASRVDGFEIRYKSQSNLLST
ncbi:MAG: glycosyltransferase family 2 protein, partial [Burkholderiales bacterium]|nr:glycosyltransferase family 2 protein [Burkholderiales bacterium]